ncbi:DUF397 domain-containing protein [Streptomyces sp. NPDC008092]|uniref:DUF397 domain-containing protein n=1 Tax=Streptomyces sp. NPDC008092 TaxID=3364808 RepID=UPI0036EDE4AA
MSIPVRWQKSSYSSFGDGDSCVEIANSPTRISVRDSKDPAAGTLTFAPAAFISLVEALKSPGNANSPSISTRMAGSVPG